MQHDAKSKEPIMSEAQSRNELSDADIAARMDRAIRRSLLTPPKPLKTARKPRQTKPKKAAAKPEIPSE